MIYLIEWLWILNKLTKGKSQTQCLTHGMDFLQLALLPLPLLWWDACRGEVGEPVCPFFSYWVLAESPLLTHSWSHGRDCVIPGNLFIGVPLSGENQPPFLASPFWRKLLGTSSGNANFTTFTGTLVLREPFPGDHFFSKCHSLYTGRYPKCLSFLLVYVPFWKGISCFCKISANSVPDRATSFQIEATNEALYCCCFLLVWEHGNVWLLVNFDWTLGKGSCDRKIRSHNSWMVI